jgi:Na+-transporting methylmalonyl-CoA/oxaloacetate decarboxylase gamma subunit
MSAVIVKALWVYGIAIVVSLLVALVIKVIVAVLQSFERKPAEVPKPVAAPAPTFDVAADHVAAIAAAVYAMIGAHRIVHIEDRHRRGEWVVEGRLAHHSSHTISHHPKH